MANRSYIYCISGDFEKEKDYKIHDIGEFSNTIPLVYKILAAYNSKTHASFIFNPRVAIVADYLEGRKKLYWLLDFLKETGAFQPQDKFEELINNTKKFLNGIDGETILLEPGEVYSLYIDNIDEIVEENEEVREECQCIGKIIDRLIELKLDPKVFFQEPNYENKFSWLRLVKQEWENNYLALDSWSDSLYITF